MTVLIKIIFYLLGAIALLFAVVSPSKQPEPVSVKTSLPDNSTLLVATNSETAENATTANAEETQTKPEPPKEIANPEPKPKPLAPLPVAASSTANSQLTTNLLSPLLPRTDQTPTTTLQIRQSADARQAPATVSALSFNDINKKTRAALVNIICTTLRSGSFEPLSGSGVLIDPNWASPTGFSPRGVILTNAHIAEYYLLKDYLAPDFVQCVIRTGEPARNRYKARLLYISPLWIDANYRKIRLAEATGTGEHDFAFLLVTESVNPETSPLPETYPALPMDFTDETLRRLQPDLVRLTVKDGLARIGKSSVLVAGYPAGFLSGINIQKEFYPSSSVVTTGQVFTFQEKTADLFSIGGSLLAQQGSSGGAVVSNAGKLIGLIVTATEGATTGERDLHAITPSHIARSFKQDTGFSLAQLLESDLAASAESFAENVAPALTKLLENALQKK